MSKHLEAMATLEEVAVSLKESAEAVNCDSPFEEGRLMGYYEALSTLLSQCLAVGIEPAEIGLAKFKPEDLLRPRKAA